MEFKASVGDAKRGDSLVEGIFFMNETPWKCSTSSYTRLRRSTLLSFVSVWFTRDRKIKKKIESDDFKNSERTRPRRSLFDVVSCEKI